MARRRLHLHIGCGKTGSSALQVWLSQNTDSLTVSGFFYPTFGSKRLDDYEITSGNGGRLLHALTMKTADRWLSNLLKQTTCENILLSSEALQKATEQELTLLKNVCEQLGVELKVVAFARNVYEIFYSTYVQLIKRHGYAKSFEDFVTSNHNVQQFAVIERWARIFPQTEVIHYDAHVDELDVALLKAIGGNPVTTPRMSKRKVNRSLDLNEAELLRFVNAEMSKYFDLDSTPVSPLVSDHLIYSHPELETRLYLSDKASMLLKTRYSKTVSDFNRRFFPKEEGLALLPSPDALTADQWPSLPPEVKYLIEALANLTGAVMRDGTVFPRKDTPKPEPTARPEDAPNIADLLREKAIALEKSHLADALILMRAAQIFRPKGPLIQTKIRQYEATLSKVKIESTGQTP